MKPTRAQVQTFGLHPESWRMTGYRSFICGVCGGTGYRPSMMAIAVGNYDEERCYWCGGSGYDRPRINGRFVSVP